MDWFEETKIANFDEEKSKFQTPEPTIIVNPSLDLKALRVLKRSQVLKIVHADDLKPKYNPNSTRIKAAETITWSKEDFW